MSGHSEHGGHGHKPEPAKNPSLVWTIAGICVIVTCLLVAYRALTGKTEDLFPNERPKARVGTEVRGVTPDNIDIEGYFALEVDGPVLMYYRGEKDPVLVSPGKPCEAFRAPKYLGSKRLVSAQDPNRPVGFYAYRTDSSCNKIAY